MKMTKDKIVTIIAVCFLIFGALAIYKGFTAKEYKFKTCAVCGKKKDCYKVIYDKKYEKYYDWVCSSKCDKTAKDFINGLTAFSDVVEDVIDK